MDFAGFRSVELCRALKNLLQLRLWQIGFFLICFLLVPVAAVRRLLLVRQAKAFVPLPLEHPQPAFRVLAHYPGTPESIFLLYLNVFLSAKGQTEGQTFCPSFASPFFTIVYAPCASVTLTDALYFGFFFDRLKVWQPVNSRRLSVVVAVCIECQC